MLAKQLNAMENKVFRISNRCIGSYNCESSTVEQDSSNSISFAGIESIKSSSGLELFACSACGQVFTSVTLVQDHLKEHMLDQSAKCFHCGLIFPDHAELDTHMTRHTQSVTKKNEVKISEAGTVYNFLTEVIGQQDLNEADLQKNTLERKPQKLLSKYFCPACNDCFDTYLALNKHLLVHKDTEFFKCATCEKVFITLVDFNNHLQTQCVLPKSTLVTCQVCSRSFSSTAKFSQHKLCHNTDKMFLCSDCGQKFSKKRSYLDHIIKHAVEAKGAKEQQPDKLFCETCNKKFSSSQVLKKHLQTHDGSVYTCTECKFVFDSRRAFVSHQKKHLRGVNNFICQLCGSNFNQKTDLNLHVRKEHRDNRPWACDLCDLTFSAKFDLTRHKLKHQGRKFYSCQFCKREFYARADLKQHEASIHSTVPREKHFMCHECGKLFYTRGHLNTHRQAHSTAQPFSCPECPARFKTKKNMAVHMRRHTGELPIKCSICGQGFLDHCYLSRHMVRHKLAPDLHCLLCKKSFFQQQQLKTHMTMTHFLCFDCEARFDTRKEIIAHRKNCLFPGSAAYLSRRGVSPATSAVIVEPVNPGGNILRPGSMDGCSNFADTLTATSGTDCLESTLAAAQIQSRNLESGTYSEQFSQHDTNTKTLLRNEHKTMHISMSVYPDVLHRFPRSIETHLAENGEQVMTDNDDSSKTPALSPIKKEEIFVPDPAQELEIEASEETVVQKFGHKIDAEDTISVEKKCKHKKWDKRRRNSGLTKEPKVGEQSSLGLQVSTDTCISGSQNCVMPEVSTAHLCAGSKDKLHPFQEAVSPAFCTDSITNINQKTYLTNGTEPLSTSAECERISLTATTAGQIDSKNTFSLSEGMHTVSEKANLKEVHNLVCDVLHCLMSNPVPSPELNRTALQAGHTTDAEVQMETFGSNVEDKHNSANLVTSISTGNKSDSHSECMHSTSDLHEGHVLVLDALKNPTNTPVTLPEFNGTVLQRGQNADVEVQRGMFGSNGEVEHNSSGLQSDVCTKNKSYSHSKSTHIEAEKANLQEMHNLVCDVMKRPASNSVAVSELNSRVKRAGQATDIEVQLETFRSGNEVGCNSTSLETRFSIENRSTSLSQNTELTKVSDMIKDARSSVVSSEFNRSVKSKTTVVERQMGTFGSSSEAGYDSSTLEINIDAENKSKHVTMSCKSMKNTMGTEDSNLNELEVDFIGDVIAVSESSAYDSQQQVTTSSISMREEETNIQKAHDLVNIDCVTNMEHFICSHCQQEYETCEASSSQHTCLKEKSTVSIKSTVGIKPRNQVFMNTDSRSLLIKLPPAQHSSFQPENTSLTNTPASLMENEKSGHIGSDSSVEMTSEKSIKIVCTPIQVISSGQRINISLSQPPPKDTFEMIGQQTLMKPGVKKFKCYYCNASFPTIKAVITHSQLHFPKQAVASSISSAQVASILATGSPPKPATTVQGPAVRHNILHLSNNTPIYVQTERGIEDEQSTLLPKIWISLPPSQSSVRSKVISLQGEIPSIINEHLPPSISPASSSTITNTVYSKHEAVQPQQPVSLNLISKEKNGKGEVAYAQPFSVKTCVAALQQSLVTTCAAPLHPVNNVVVTSDLRLDVSHPDKCKMCGDDLADETKKGMESCVKINALTSQFENGIKKKSAASALNNSDIDYGTALACNINEINYKNVSSSLEKDFIFEKNSHAPEITDTKSKMCELGESSLLFQCSDCRDAFCTLSEFAAHAKKQHKMSMPHPGRHRSFLKQQKRLDKTEEGVLKNELDKNSRTLSVLKETDGKLVSHDSEQKSDTLQKGASEDTATSALKGCAGSPDRDLENGIHYKRPASTLATFPESCHQPGPKHGRMSVMELAAAAEVVEDTLWQLDHPYKCDVCSTSFSYFSQIMHHLDSSHGRQELYQCSHCIGVFSSLATLTIHFQMHAQLMAGLAADTITTQSNCSYNETGIGAGKSQEQFFLAKHKDKEDDFMTEISDSKAQQDQITANHQSSTSSASTKGRFSGFSEVADAKSKTSGIAHLSLDRMHTPEHFSHGLTLENLAEAAVALAERGEKLDTSRENLDSQSPRKISSSLGTKSTWEASYTVGGQTFIILVSLPVSAHVALSQSSTLPGSTSSQTKDSEWQQKSQPETTSDRRQILQDSALSTLSFTDQHGAKKSKKIFKCLDGEDLCLEAIGDLEDPECSQTNMETCGVPQYTAKNMDSHHIVNASHQIQDVQISNTETVITAKKDLVESGNHKYTSVTEKRVTPSDRCKLEITSDSDDIEILSADESVDDNFMPTIEFPSGQSLSQCQKASHLYEVVSSDQSDICPRSIKTLTQNSSSNLGNASICSSLHSDLNVDMNAEDREVSMSDCKLRRGSLRQKVLQSKQRLFQGEFRSRTGCIKKHPISSCVKSKAHNTSRNCKSSPSLSLTDHSFVKASSERETPGLKDDLLIDSGNHFQCELCRMSFTLKSQLDMHVVNHCSQHGAFSCRSCEREFRSYTHLVTHMLQHVSGLSFFCSQCTAAFNHQAALQAHLHTHQKDPCSCIKSTHFHTLKSDLQEIHRNYCFTITPSKDDQIDDACTQNIMSSRKEALFDKNLHKVKEIDLHQVKNKWMNSHTNCVYAGGCIGDDADGDNDDYDDDTVVESNEDTFNSKNCRINVNADKRDNVTATASDNSEKEDSETFIKDHDPFSKNDDIEDERGGLKLYKPQVLDEEMFVTNSNSAEIVNKEKMDTENPFHTQPEQDLKSVTFAAQQHMQPSQRKNRVVCHLCGRNFCNNHYLKLHILKHEASQQEGKECPYCGRSFYHDMALRAHMKRHTLGFSFVCDICGKAYKDKYTLKWHKKHHAGERRYPCPVCQKQFSNRSDMEYHHQSHDSGASHPRPRPFHCLTCGKRFSRQKYLNLHSKRHDRAVVPFVCPTCGIARASKRALEVHERSHTGEHPYKCSHCGQGFVSAPSLARHKFTHTGHTPFTCKTCGKSFLRKDGLQQHEARHAMSDVPKQFVCDFCGKVLRSKSGLMTHLRSHSSIRNGVGVGDGVGVAIGVDNDIVHINGDGDILYKEY